MKHAVKHTDDKVQTGLRIPVQRCAELTRMAETMGISLNALILLLVDVGLSAINLGAEAMARSGPHSPQHSDEQ